MPSWQSSSVSAACDPAANKATSFAGRLSATCCSSSYHGGQFWVGLAEHVEDGRYGAARIVFGAEPSNEEILRFVVNKWAKLSFFGHDPTEASKPAKNPKRRAREAAKALKRPAVSTKAQQALAAQREAMKRESARARSQRRADEAEVRFEQRKLKRKQKHRGH
ncbi:MAG: YjdF family protein [Collinsella sp.]|nr:YjdF family protein [Collinsella sp.]